MPAFKKVLTFVPESRRPETKGAMRYEELKEGAFEEPTVGTLYIRKSAFKEIGRFPTQLTITIEETQG